MSFPQRFEDLPSVTLLRRIIYYVARAWKLFLMLTISRRDGPATMTLCWAVFVEYSHLTRVVLHHQLQAWLRTYLFTISSGLRMRFQVDNIHVEQDWGWWNASWLIFRDSRCRIGWITIFSLLPSDPVGPSPCIIFLEPAVCLPRLPAWVGPLYHASYLGWARQYAGVCVMYYRLTRWTHLWLQLPIWIQTGISLLYVSC